MAENKWMDAYVQLRRMYNLMAETESLSQQLAEEVDRGDSVTIRMLLSMREEPVRKLAVCRQILQQLLVTLEPKEAAQLRELLNGGPAREEADQELVKQVALNGRLLKRIQEQDEVLNRKIAQEDSVYS